jgi:predicted RNA-binding protein YlqC (UPF0109 family)
MFKDLIEYIATSLVDQPDQVKVHEVVGEKVTILELSVAEEDLGKIIGKHGRTLKSIRNILFASGIKANKRIVLELVESSKE